MNICQSVDVPSGCVRCGEFLE